MTPLRVLFVSELPDSESGTHQYARFLDDLGRYLGEAVPLARVPLCEVKQSVDFVILETLDVEQSLARCDDNHRSQLAKRLIPLYPRRGRGLFHSQMERLPLVGALEALRVGSQDLADAVSPKAHGLTGRRDLASLIGITCADDLMMPPSGYCFMESTKHNGIAHLLADYLRCFALSSCFQDA